MQKLLIMIYVLVLSPSLYSQDSKLSEAESAEKGTQIVKNSQKVVGLGKTAIKSLYFKSKSSIAVKNGGSDVVNTVAPVTEISIVMPDKIQSSFIMDQSLNVKLISIWNGSKFKKVSESEMFGARTVRDITDTDSQNNLKAMEGRIDKERLDYLRKVGKKDPKKELNNRIWVELFPLILAHPFEENLKFKYVGKAESSNRVANVVDVKSQNGRTYRLLFDSETNYLILMIETYNIAEGAFEGDYETKYYFSNRALADNVLIPKKIKVEQKFKPIGKALRISYTDIDILEFAVNPEFKKDMFDIK